MKKPLQLRDEGKRVDGGEMTLASSVYVKLLLSNLTPTIHYNTYQAFIQQVSSKALLRIRSINSRSSTNSFKERVGAFYVNSAVPKGESNQAQQSTLLNLQLYLSHNDPT